MGKCGLEWYNMPADSGIELSGLQHLEHLSFGRENALADKDSLR